MSSSVILKRLEGRTILITRASSGIGRSRAIEFARSCQKNLHLILIVRRIVAVEEVKSQINKDIGNGVKIFVYKLDVSKSDEVNFSMSYLPEEFHEIDVLVNNAQV